ncbi:MAG: YCF48-related protein, partial [Ignavibacteriaceae bacterium]
MNTKAKKLYYLKKQFILSLLMFTSVVYSQGWQWQNPLPQGNALSSIQYLTNNIIFAGVLGGGSILKSTDGGNTWKTIVLPERIYIEDIFFISENKGWVCGEIETESDVFGIVMGTIDGGKTWETQLDISYQLTTIKFADERNGWVSGTAARVYHTTNGGQNWEMQVNLPGDIHSFFVVDTLNVWAANTGNVGGALYYTNDGGKNWLADSTIDWSNDIQFVDSLNGWIAGRDKIARTMDGGKSWETQLETLSLELTDICMYDTINGWALTSFNTKIAITTNGGKNWQIRDNPADYDLNAISFSD